MHRQPRATCARVLSGGFDAAAGLWLLAPMDTLDSSPGYRVLRTWLLGDVPLGLALLGYALVILWGCFRDEAPRVVDAATFLAALTWLLFAGGLMRANPEQLGSVAYSLPVALHAWAYFDTRWRRTRSRLEPAP